MGASRMAQQIIFWQNIPSIHQSALIRNFANFSDYEVVLICEQDISAERRSLGWQIPDYGNAEVIISPKDKTIRDLIFSRGIQKTHILGGTRSNSLVKEALRKSLGTDATIGIYSEMPDHPYGVTGIAKRILYSIDALKLKNRLKFFLAVGKEGSEWYGKCGYPAEIIFPFGYFLEQPNLDCHLSMVSQNEKAKLRIVFIGNLIKRKGVDLLLKAVAALQEMNWGIQIIGDGVERKELVNLCDSLGLKHQIKFLGVMNNNDAMRTLECTDLLVLPSLHDGWGAVVNEALMRGVPAICSDRCGASVLLNGTSRGEVFEAGNVAALRETLERWIRNGPLKKSEKTRIKTWATLNISGKTAVNYLNNILLYTNGNGKRPQAPWNNLDTE